MTLMDKITSHLQANEIKYQLNEPEGRVEFFLASEDIVLPVTIRVLAELEQVLVHVYYPTIVPVDRRMMVAEFLMRANYGLRLGNFEMDLDDGEVRFKASVDVEGGELTDPMVYNLIRTAVGLSNRYHPGIMALCFSDSTPREEIYRIEEG